MFTEEGSRKGTNCHGPSITIWTDAKNQEKLQTRRQHIHHNMHSLSPVWNISGLGPKYINVRRAWLGTRSRRTCMILPLYLGCFRWMNSVYSLTTWSRCFGDGSQKSSFIESTAKNTVQVREDDEQRRWPTVANLENIWRFSYERTLPWEVLVLQKVNGGSPCTARWLLVGMVMPWSWLQGTFLEE